MLNDNPMKYRFVVEYEDGSLFEQNEEDVSKVDPKRSAFFDIQQDRVKTFSKNGHKHRFRMEVIWK